MTILKYLLEYVEEDAPFGDITSDSVVPDEDCNAQIKAEEPGIIAGIEEAVMLFSHFGVTAIVKVRDGDRVCPGEILISLNGNARAILLVERTALNIIGRMSGIASQTKKMSEIILSVNPHCRVTGTRKTCPGFRIFDKKAIKIGGGDPHRYCLSDGILIKDNHLALIPLHKAIASARKATRYKKIEVEVESAGDAVQAAEAGADILMFDNMKPDEIQETLDVLNKKGLREGLVIEISGGINESTLKNYALPGIDAISMGSLTHTVKNFSVNLEILPKS